MKVEGWRGMRQKADFPYFIFHFSFSISRFKLEVPLQVEYTIELIAQTETRQGRTIMENEK